MTDTGNLGLGIDFGGTGIKGALVDLDTGDLISRRVRIATPSPSTPSAVAKTVAKVVARIAAEQPIPDGIPVGCGLPAPIKDGRVMTAANIDKRWIGESVGEVLGAALGRTVVPINDADAAGLCELRIGAARDAHGTLILLTIGTGIGSALLVDGALVPNTEFGHLEFHGQDAETLISGVAREKRKLRWKAWATEFNEYLGRLELYFWPDLFVLGGGVSKVFDKYQKFLRSRAPIVPAAYRNTSGIIGAAMHAADVLDG